MMNMKQILPMLMLAAAPALSARGGKEAQA